MARKLKKLPTKPSKLLTLALDDKVIIPGDPRDLDYFEHEGIYYWHPKDSFKTIIGETQWK